MAGHNTGRCVVHGTVATGFEPVKRLYETSMNTMAEEHAQLCVYHRGRKVVDLWASTTADSHFSADSLVNIFSSGKNFEAIAIAALVDRGLVRYDARIADYWPAFGANGKGELTVAELMRHEAGLAYFNTPMALDALLTENIKQNTVGRIIEGHAQEYAGGAAGRREYHAVTRGWIVNELFRRCDPAHRTIGEFLREEINRPLGVEVIVGATEEELSRRAPVTPLGFGYQLRQSLKPRFLGRRIVHNIFQIAGRILRILPVLRRLVKARPPAPFKGMEGIGFFNEPAVARGETPSANTHSSAKSLARVAAMLAAGGTLDGTTCLGGEAWKALHDHATHARMSGLFSTRFTQGGVNQFTACAAGSPVMERQFNTGREGFYGWMGLGGSIFQWHPELDIGFGFVPTSLHILDFFNERGKIYQAEVLRCVERLSG